MKVLFIFVVALISTAIQAAAVSGQGSWETTLFARDVNNDGTVDAYYDSALNITWLADANYAATNNFGITGIPDNGIASWHEANEWVDAMNFASHLGSTSWRLPGMESVDGTNFYSIHSYNGSTNRGYNLTAQNSAYPDFKGAELAYMFYNTLGNSGYRGVDGQILGCSLYAPECLTNSGPFSNIKSNNDYWYGQLVADTINSNSAFDFDFSNGSQGDGGILNSGYAWAVMDGDISASVVPIPAPFLLFGSGLAALGWFRRKG